MVFGSSSFPSIYSLPKVGHRDQAAEWIQGKGHKVFDRLEIPRRSRTIPPLPIRLLHLSCLYTEKELRAAKLCKHLLRKPSNSAFTRWKTKLKTVGRTLSDPRLVNEHSGDQS